MIVAERRRGGEIEVSEAARELAREIDPETASAAVTAEIMRQVWPDQEDDGFAEAVDRSVLGNVRAILDIIGDRLAIEDAEPQDALDFAELTARLEVPLPELERAYRIGVTTMWGLWFEIARSAAEPRPAALGELIDGPTITMLTYIDHILSVVTSRHEAIRCELARTRRHLRRATLMQVLDGTIDDVTDELAQTLGYGLGDTHLALLVQTEESRCPDREIATLRSAADARATLSLQHGVHAWVVWLGRPAGFGPTQLSRLRRAFADSGLTIAVGEPASGLAGLRRSREQALDTARVQRALGAAGHRCLWASEVRLESLLLADEPRARAFVAAELGRLSGPDSAAQRLRETLLAWLATGSHVSAAAILGVHENTIRNRIRHAEELLDSSLLQRRTELQVALRLERVLGTQESAGEVGEVVAAA
jgi:hypothetical protein